MCTTNEFLMSGDVGFALMQAGLSPFALDIDLFQIVHEGENYLVHTDRLPEIYVENRVPLDLFEYRKQDWIILFAMDRVNSRRSPVVVFNAGSSDTVTFRCCIQGISFEDLPSSIDSCFGQIGQAVNAFGIACDLATSAEDIHGDKTTP